MTCKKSRSIRKTAAKQRAAQQSPASAQENLSLGVSPLDGVNTRAVNPGTSSADPAVPGQVDMPGPIALGPPAMNRRPLPYPHYFLARPATAAMHTASGGTVTVAGPLVPLIPLDELPPLLFYSPDECHAPSKPAANELPSWKSAYIGTVRTWLEVVGVPREFSAEQVQGMEYLGEIPKTDELYEVRFHHDVRLTETPTPPEPTCIATAAATAAMAAGSHHPESDWEGGGQVMPGRNNRLPQAPVPLRRAATAPPGASPEQRDGHVAASTAFGRVVKHPQHQHQHQEYQENQEDQEQEWLESPQRHQSEPHGKSGSSGPKGLEQSMHAKPKKNTTKAAAPHPHAALSSSTASSSYNPKAPKKQPKQRKQPKAQQKQPKAQPQQAAGGGDGGRRVCRKWCHTGYCAYGARCRHEHTMPQTAKGLADVGLDGPPEWWAQAVRVVQDLTVAATGPTNGSANRQVKRGAAAAAAGQPTPQPACLMDADADADADLLYRFELYDHPDLQSNLLDL